MVDASLPANPIKSIAIVDDDEDVAAALGSLVDSMNVQPHIFHSADAFLASAIGNAIDLVISDVQMPGTGGLEFARILRGAGVPLILITAFPSAEVERQAMVQGVRCFMRKPFDPTALIACIEAILDG
ncbi:FixJ family two-component response regulator [Sphingomonas zeicaulis]|uniref:response regulator transcription factor n=1 Tax=Sphingomonas zeicaulis TaxID=1632740 RepID=UPI003D23DEE6